MKNVLDFKPKAIKLIYPEIKFTYQNNKFNILNNINIDLNKVEQKAKELEEKYNKQQTIEKIKTEGLTYTLNNQTYKIPLTSKDAIGLIQVKNAFELGIQNTIMYFSNGVKIPLNKENFTELATWFSEKRNLLFVNPDKLLSEES